MASIVPDIDDRAAWGRIPSGLRDNLLAAADDDGRRRWPYPLLSRWTEYARSGSRVTYEAPEFALHRRVRRSVLAALADPAVGRVANAADGLWLLCEQSSWCWPAHDDAFGRGLLTTDVSRPFVDLGAGETAALFAWSATVLGPALEREVPGVLERLGTEVRRRVTGPFIDRAPWHWQGDEGHCHNWVPWVHGNVFIAAAVFESGSRRDRVLDEAVDGIDRYLALLPLDGAVDEGFGYFWRGAAAALDVLVLLDRLSPGAVAREIQEGSLRELPRLTLFPELMSLGGDWVVSFADADARVSDDLPWHSLFQAARLCGLPATARRAASHRTAAWLLNDEHAVDYGLGRSIAALLDVEWWGEEPENLVPAGNHHWASIDVAVMRSGGEQATDISVVLKGGDNAENHNHNDLGSIEVAVDGVPLIIDLGRGTYDARTFSAERDRVWNVSSAWHSTVSPRGLAQRYGSEWRAPIHREDESGFAWSIELGDAYPLGPDERWTRRVALDSGSGEVAVDDAWSLIAEDGTSVSYVCVGRPTTLADRSILIGGREGSRDLLLRHDGASVRIEVRDVDDPHLSRCWGESVSRIILTPAADAGGIRVRLSARS